MFYYRIKGRLGEQFRFSRASVPSQTTGTRDCLSTFVHTRTVSFVKLIYSNYPMRGSSRSRLTAVLVCILITCTLFTAFALTFGIHEHGVSHSCAFCGFGHVSSLGAPQAPQILPPVTRQVLLALEPASRAVERGAKSASGRAPPSC